MKSMTLKRQLAPTAIMPGTVKKLLTVKWLKPPAAYICLGLGLTRHTVD
jgi:hypothetical protein